MTTSTLTTVRIFFLEEWRLHTERFGGWRFAFFPAFITVLTVGAAIGLTTTGTSPAAIVAGVHLFALAFGLYSGTAGFAGSDMLENVFGRLSLLLATSATLPVSRRRLLGLFLLKDGAFYGLVIVTPMAIGLLPVLEPGSGTVLALWLSLLGSFGAGMVCTVAAISLATRGVPGWAIGVGALAVVFVTWFGGYADAAWPFVAPYAGSTATGVGLVGGIVLLGTTALAMYDPSYAKPARTAGDRFARVDRRLPIDGRGLVTKSLFDLARSSGGVWKPFVSVGILFALVAFMVGVVREITGIEPAPGIFFGGVLGLSAFTTYNWLTQFDSVEDYLAYPVAVEDVFAAKRTAFVIVGIPTVTAPYLVGVLWFDATLLDATVGALLLVGYGLYYYGLTVYIAGFDPNEFLFDAARFATFTVGVAVALVPALVAGFVVVPPTGTVAALVGGSSLVFGVVGYVLSTRAGPRWSRRYRRGGN